MPHSKLSMCGLCSPSLYKLAHSNMKLHDTLHNRDWLLFAGFCSSHEYPIKQKKRPHSTVELNERKEKSSAWINFFIHISCKYIIGNEKSDIFSLCIAKRPVNHITTRLTQKIEKIMIDSDFPINYSDLRSEISVIFYGIGNTTFWFSVNTTKISTLRI